MGPSMIRARKTPFAKERDLGFISKKERETSFPFPHKETHTQKGKHSVSLWRDQSDEVPTFSSSRPPPNPHLSLADCIFLFFLFQLLKVGMHQLVLQEVTLDSTGLYMCQITESKPPFHTEQKQRNLTVISEYMYIYIKLKKYIIAQARN